MLLNRRNGRPLAYWRIGTTDDERDGGKYWPMMRDENVVAIGWSNLGDLSGWDHSRESREKLSARLNEVERKTPQVIGRHASQILQFVSKIAEGDRVLAADGQTILGVGQVTGAYRFEPSGTFRHRRPVAWHSHAGWKMPEPEGLRTTVSEIHDYQNEIEAERHILDDGDRARPVPVLPPTGKERNKVVREPLRLFGTAGLLQAVLERKGQAILYGPPGTGKTFWAIQTARDLASHRTHGVAFGQLDEGKKRQVIGGPEHPGQLVRMTSFHPEYGYEDFIEGYRPVMSGAGTLGFQLVPGVFRRLCDDAAARPDLDFFLIIDEINRGDVPRIFGELLTLLEKDKRGQTVTLPMSQAGFTVPNNVFVIGTMNTADRSIALLDVALRRRFGFVELMPDYEILSSRIINGLALGPWLEALNARIRALSGSDARNRQIGHAFLLAGEKPVSTPEQFAAVLRDDILPLLEEYCYEDFGQLADIIGKPLVDPTKQRIRREMFEASRLQDLIDSLIWPEIVTSTATVKAEAESELVDSERETLDFDEAAQPPAQR
jgi:5-methylcytosine-specific restriction protein B